MSSQRAGTGLYAYVFCIKNIFSSSLRLCYIFLLLLRLCQCATKNVVFHQLMMESAQLFLEYTFFRTKLNFIRWNIDWEKMG
jgi:hypothetical protein